MAKIYLRKINNGEMIINDVPARWKSEVQELLNTQG